MVEKKKIGRAEMAALIGEKIDSFGKGRANFKQTDSEAFFGESKEYLFLMRSGKRPANERVSKVMGYKRIKVACGECGKPSHMYEEL